MSDLEFQKREGFFKLLQIFQKKGGFLKIMTKIIFLIIFILSDEKKHIVWLLTIDFQKCRVYQGVRMALKQLHILLCEL